MTVPVYDYAVRYCLGRQSYAFEDGLAIADRHWFDLAESTRRDVLNAVQGRKIDRYPMISAVVYQGGEWTEAGT